MNINKLYGDLSVSGKIIFNVAIVFVLVALIDRMFVGPLLADQKTVEEEISRQEMSIVRDLRFLSYKNRIVKERDSFTKYLVDEYPEESKSKSDFLNEIQEIAVQSNIKLIKSTSTGNKVENDYMLFFASGDCSGELRDIITFIHKVNSSNSLLKITQFNMNPKRGTSSEVNLTVNISKMIMKKQI